MALHNQMLLHHQTINGLSCGSCRQALFQKVELNRLGFSDRKRAAAIVVGTCWHVFMHMACV